ncbi:protein ROS1 isoform X2 [Sesamum indicum]|uniref:Protein ROS1 isoform X2 n=1 Tax=Sesamum indicum TaxID=4182 RepID=A0A6I9TY52_SESIN|nr:protein ROS1 isoform X2 [Sesamum indicum]
MELESSMAGELKEKGAWVPLTPVKPVPARHDEINSSASDKGVNHDVGSVENPQLSQIWGELGKESGNCGFEFGNSGRVCLGRDQEVAENCDGSVSNVGAVEGVKTAEDCSGGVARKSGFAVFGDPGSSFESLGLHGKPDGIIGGTSDNRSRQNTIDVDVSSAWKKSDHNSQCKFGPDSTKASNMPKNQTPKKRSNKGIDSNKKPRKRARMIRHRPKVFDESKPIKPSTPKPRTPKRTKYVKKDSRKTPVDPSKDVDREVVGNYSKLSCRQKLEFSTENCAVNQNSEVCDEIKITTGVEPQPCCRSRFSYLKVYRRIFRPNECLKNSRKLGPNCPNMFKKARMRRKRVTVFDKLTRLVSMIPTSRKQRSAASNGPFNFYPGVKDRKNKSRTLSQRWTSWTLRKRRTPRTSSRRQKSTEKMTREAIKHPRFDKCTLNSTWMVNLKRKRSKASTRIRDLSSFVNDLSKIQVSEAFLRMASSIRTQGSAKFAACMAVQGEGPQSLAIEQQELPQDNLVSCNESIQISPTEFADCVLGVEIDIPNHSLEMDILNYQVVEGHSVVAKSMKEMVSFSDKLLPYHKSRCNNRTFDIPPCFQPREDINFIREKYSLESDIVTPYLMGPHHEQKNVFSIRDYNVFTQALVDFATQRIESLHIDDGCNQLVVRNQIVHGALVPSKGKFDPSKRRKPLPKVDLDAETMRVWNLLMENNGTDDTEQEDDDKAKYWKKQREIFDGRVESFIARMHLIQGDRRFSPWKGSVVDSVVGVFLTQNVSDHLSSSAFMSLAARFPPPTVSEQNGLDDRSDCLIDESKEVKIAETPSGKCEELLMMENYPSSSSPPNKVGVDPNNHVGVDLEKGNETSLQTESTSRKKGKVKDKQENTINWDELRKNISHGSSRNRTYQTMDSVNWEAVRQAKVEELAKVIMERGMNNILAGRIKDFLDRMVRDHGSIDLEWLRDVPPDRAKEYLLSIPGLGLKSVECVRLLTLRQHAFPVDTNVGRILVRLGWVPLQPLPEDVQIHLLNQYPLLDTIQKYIWPRMCQLQELTLYECHYQMITFGKVFCTKRRPNCNACPMRAECRHFASEFASTRLRLEGSKGQNTAPQSSVASIQDTTELRLEGYKGQITAPESSVASIQDTMDHISPPKFTLVDGDCSEGLYNSCNCEPIVEMPLSPEPECTGTVEIDIEDLYCDSDDEIPTIKLNGEEFRKNVLTFMGEEDGISKSLVTLSPETASIPMPKLKYVGRLRTVHHVYEIPDSHPLLAGFEKREPDDPCPYLLAIWTADESTRSSQEPRKACNCKKSTTCDMSTCSGQTVQNENDQTVQGTILIPCRTANRGAFPLNGTYFQVFADHESSRHPIAVPREWIWNLRRRALFCGTSVTSISRGLSLEQIEYCFRKGFICVRGINRKMGAARPLARRFHLCKTRQVDDE